MSREQFHEQKFFNALRDIFVGAEIEGESGFINLMRIKSRYYTEGVFPHLKADIDQAVAPFPGFREELFDKLHTFFKRYFSESGSIYFRYTPLHQNVYEKVYTDERDVVLFWKTHMLYYVKTDRIFNSLKVDVDGVNFYFDAANIEHKRANEKRDVVFTFREVAQDGTLVFDTAYSVRGRITKIDDILRDLRKEDITISDETLEKAFRVFEKQSEVDYFINKNARAFLEEQFDLWLYQYLFAEQNVWSAERLAQLQALKGIAYKVIGFISQFEDELVKIWNKPKFARGSHYIVTLDHLLRREKTDLLADLFAHPGMTAQIEEWVSLGMLEKAIKPQELLRQIMAKDLTGISIHSLWGYLTLDTIYFPDFELTVLSSFNDIDSELDGWVIQSENYQALNTIEKKFSKSFKCIHIDPPYNTDSSGFLYLNNYQHASWICMMDNRIEKANNLLHENGSLLIHVDENEFDHLNALLRTKNYSYLGTIIWNKKHPMMGGSGIANQHEYILWSSNHTGTFDTSNKNSIEILNKASHLIEKYGGVNETSRKVFSKWIRNNSSFSGGERAYQFIDDDGRVFQSVGMGWPNPNPPPPDFYRPLIHPVTGRECPVPPRGWSRSPEKMQELLDNGEIIFGEDETVQPRRKIFLKKSTTKPISSIIDNGQKGKTELDCLGLEFSYSHPVSLYKEITHASLLCKNYGMVIDFFSGSGTSANAVMNLNREDEGSRKYLLVEMGDHFYDVLLPRIKKIAFNSKWKDGKPVFADGESGMSQFVKVYSLEQYEETLQRVRYEDADLFNDPNQDPYHAYVFLRDLKLLDSIETDPDANEVRFHPEQLYPDIDLAETISHLRGKWIKRITEDFVEFEDGEQMSLTDPDWETLKPMVWWG